jgi:hypothetical protein
MCLWVAGPSPDVDMVIAALLSTNFSSPPEAPNGQAGEAERAQPPAGVASPRHKRKQPDPGSSPLHDLLASGVFARSACVLCWSRCSTHEVVLSFQCDCVLSFQMLFRPGSGQDDGLANNQSRPPPRDVFRLRQLQRAKAAGSLPGVTSSAGTVSTGSRSGSH